jgi:hypothetical protein
MREKEQKMDKPIEAYHITDKTPERTFAGITINVDHRFTPFPDRDCFILCLYSGSGEEDQWSDSICIRRSSREDMQKLNALLWLIDKSHSTKQVSQYNYSNKIKPEDSLITVQNLRYDGNIQQDIIYRIGKSIFFPSGLSICTLFALDHAHYMALGCDLEEVKDAVLDMFSYDSYTAETDEGIEWECPAWPTDDCGDLHEIYVDSLVYHDPDGREWPCKFSFDKNIMGPEIAHINIEQSLEATINAKPS